MRRPATFFIKAEAFAGVVGWYLPKIGQIAVRRGVPEREPLVTALAVLAEGGVVGIFPEGRRRTVGQRQVDTSTSRDATGDLQVRHGIAYLALRSGCPVLPVACVGTERVLPRGRLFPRVRQPVTVAFGRPSRVAEPGERPTRAAIAAAGARVQQLMADHLREVSHETAPTTLAGSTTRPGSIRRGDGTSSASIDTASLAGGTNGVGGAGGGASRTGVRRIGASAGDTPGRGAAGTSAAGAGASGSGGSAGGRSAGSAE